VHNLVCSLAHSLPNRDVIDEITTRSAFSVFKRDRHVVFVTATAENPVSLKCVITEGSKTLVALSDALG